MLLQKEINDNIYKKIIDYLIHRALVQGRDGTLV